MGGFAGGDEAGFWEEEAFLYTHKKQVLPSLQYELDESGCYHTKAYAKDKNLLTYDENKQYFTSHLKRLDSLYDTISFKPAQCNGFCVYDEEGLLISHSSIHRTYALLNKALSDTDVEEFFETHSVYLTCKIPKAEHYAASASQAAMFMLLLKEVCSLALNTQELFAIAKELETYTPFFLYNTPSAKVHGSNNTIERVEILSN